LTADIFTDAGADVRTFIVSTSLEETWPSSGKIVFLGEWCLLPSRKHIWQKLDYTVLPYRWDKRELIAEDIEFLESVYETIMPGLAKSLNELHNVTYSLRYWEIILGWWLFYFSQICFDRWKALQTSELNFPGAQMVTLSSNSNTPNDSDMADFVAGTLSEKWNERLFADIARKWTKIECVENTELAPDFEENRWPPSGNNLSLRKSLARSLSKKLTWVSRLPLFYGRGVDLHLDYLARFEKVKLMVSLGQFPSFQSVQSPPFNKRNPAMRDWEIPMEETDDFSRLLSSLVVHYIPSVYIEGFVQTKKIASQFGSVIRPKVIMTANAFSQDDVWKFWAAENCEYGAKLVISQHGGFYGLAEVSASFLHESRISDRYLSWGWGAGTEPKVRIAPANKLLSVPKRRGSARDILLLVTTQSPRYLNNLASSPLGPQWSRYFEDQQLFTQTLAGDARHNLVVRLNKAEFGWEQEKRWGETGFQGKLDPGHTPLSILWKKTKLHVDTYNGTTFLESLARGIPTVIFWRPNHWELSAEAKPFIEQLRKASVFFDDPFLCASHVNDIWPDVEKWWHSERVTEAVASFTARYAFVGNRPIIKLGEALTDW